MNRSTDMKRQKNFNIIVLLFYNIDLLENCLEILKTAINREVAKDSTEFGSLLKCNTN
jgi:hypothetical protein